jgi:hypothetical protein
MFIDFGREIASALLGIFLFLIGRLWFAKPTIVFGHPENIADQKFLTWWHLPIQIRPLFLQRKLLKDCAVSAYVHGGGIGTIVSQVNLCWGTGDGPQRTVTIEANRIYFVPVSLRSTHWTNHPVEVNRKTGLSVAVPPRMAFFCDQQMMLAARIPKSRLSNEYYLSFRIHRSGRTLRRSGLYKLVVPFQEAENSEFTFEKNDPGSLGS